MIPAYKSVGTIEPLLAQLAALPEVAKGYYKVIVSDDASKDRSVAILRSRWPHFKYVKSQFNTGFAANANRGAGEASREFVAIVNSDIELVGNPFPRLIAALAEDLKCFAAMPLVFNTALGRVENLQFLRTSRGLVWNDQLFEARTVTTQVENWLSSGGSGELPDWGVGNQITTILCGACFVCRTDSLWKLGGFGRDFYPFYWEDVDLGMIAQERFGWRSVAVASTLVRHRHSESIDKAHGQKKLRFLRLNQLRFCLKWRDVLNLGQMERWLYLRGLRELWGGDPVLRDAYFKVAAGARRI